MYMFMPVPAMPSSHHHHHPGCQDGIAKLEHFWLGGGHVDLKLRLNTAEAIKTFEMTVADVTS